MSTGTGWSATTPLWYTLQLDNQFLHTGLRKEGGFLDMVRKSPLKRLIEEKNQKKRNKKMKHQNQTMRMQNRKSQHASAPAAGVAQKMTPLMARMAASCPVILAITKMTT